MKIVPLSCGRHFPWYFSKFDIFFKCFKIQHLFFSKIKGSKHSCELKSIKKHLKSIELQLQSKIWWKILDCWVKNVYVTQIVQRRKFTTDGNLSQIQFTCFILIAVVYFEYSIQSTVKRIIEKEVNFDVLFDSDGHQSIESN